MVADTVYNYKITWYFIKHSSLKIKKHTWAEVLA